MFRMFCLTNIIISNASIILAYRARRAAFSTTSLLYNNNNNNNNDSDCTNDSLKDQKELSEQLTTSQETIPILPEHFEEPIKQSAKLSNLGPVVINKDGSIGTINNWHEMSDFERANVYKMVVTRNRERLEALKKKPTIEYRMVMNSD